MKNNTFKFISLKNKLLTHSVSMVVIIFIVVGSLVYYGLTSLSTKFLDLSTERSQETRIGLKGFLKQNSERMRNVFTKELEDKGRNLLLKDASSFQTMFQDNAYGQVKSFLKRNVSEDSEIIHASFFVYEDGEVSAWQYVDSNYLRGFIGPVVYDRQHKKWIGRYNEKDVEINDDHVLEIIETNDLIVELREIPSISPNSNSPTEMVFDCHIPVWSGELGGNLKAARENGEPVGFLRYILSFDVLSETLKLERESLSRYLSQVEQSDHFAAQKTERLGRELLNTILILLAVAALVIVTVAYFLSLVVSNRITRPIKLLTDVAGKMSKGEYSQTIDIKTNDEVGILASTFQAMSHAILKRDKDLNDLNADLERLVQERTDQLAQEMVKVTNLLNNMKQSIFSVREGGEIVSPVSEFSKEIFYQDIIGKNIFDILYKDMNQKSEQFSALETAMNTVFGEGKLQWMFMEEQFPSRIEVERRVSQSTIETQVLKIKYIPICNSSDEVERIMFVIEDVTELEELERKVTAQEIKYQKKMKMLQEIAACNVDDLKTFFKKSFHMLENVRQSMERDDIEQGTLNQLKRNVHTLKGNSRVFGFLDLSSKLHHFENQINLLGKKTDDK